MSELNFETRAMILKWLNGATDARAIDTLAGWMSQALRIGGKASCRKLIAQALAA